MQLPAFQPSGSFSGFTARRVGFSRRETLVLIVILGVLASILIPVWGAARTRTHAADSVSNLRELARAHLAYETEFGHVPTLTNWDEGGKSWAHRIAPYLGIDSSSFINGLPPPKVFCLPGLKNPVVADGSYTYYSRNMIFTLNTDGVTGLPQPKDSINKRSDLAEPAKTWLISEWNPLTHWNIANVNGIKEFPGLYGGRYAFALMDGHVETFKAGQLPTQHDPKDSHYRKLFWDPRVDVVWGGHVFRPVP